MLFTKRLRDGVRRGEITCSVRIWTYPHVKVGGRYRMVAHTEQGRHEVGGIYREVKPNEKLVFTWAWHSTPERESLVTVLLKPDGDGTLLTLTYEQFFDEGARDRHQSGWTEGLDKLAALFA
jgi:uncharacterized protein YndB with AHSA1/START domain